MTKIRSAMLLSLAFVPSAFAAAADALPSEKYTSVTMALFIFSFLVMVRFAFFSEKYKKYRISFLALVLFLSIILFTWTTLFGEADLGTFGDMETFGDFLMGLYFSLMLFGIIATIIGLIMGFVLICKKNKFIIISALSILAIEIVAVILTAKYYIISSEKMFSAIADVTVLNGIIGMVFISCLLNSLRNKSNSK